MNRKIIIFLFFITILHNFYSVYARHHRLFNGEDVDLRDKLFFVQLLFKGYCVCGASIINERWLITAAHCVNKWSSFPLFYSVIIGTIVRGGAKEDEIQDVILHPNYNKKPVYDDIALINLKKRIHFNNYVTFVRIANRPPQVGDEMKVFGLGRVGDKNDVDTRLRFIDIPVVHNVRCNKNYRYFDYANSFCAGLGQKDSCKGDSGGPGVIDNKLAGIVSYGPPCGMNQSGVYTNVYAYRDWIESVVKPKLKVKPFNQLINHQFRRYRK